MTENHWLIEYGIAVLLFIEVFKVVAVVRGEDTEWLADVLWARRYDLDTQKFVEQPSNGVRCLNEGWGL